MLKPLGFEFIPHIAHLFIEQEFNALWLKISFSTSTKGGFTCRNESIEKKSIGQPGNAFKIFNKRDIPAHSVLLTRPIISVFLQLLLPADSPSYFPPSLLPFFPYFFLPMHSSILHTHTHTLLSLAVYFPEISNIKWFNTIHHFLFKPSHHRSFPAVY